MTEREVKNKNPFKDHILESLLGKKNSDSKSDGFSNNGFENQNSLLSENSPRKLNEDLRETNSEIEISKNSTAPEFSNDTREISELTRIGEKTKRNFKSMTLDRMGKMLKIKSSNSNQSEAETKKNENLETRTIFYPYDQCLSKEKTNSLGRVFKIMDKNINPGRMFGQSTKSKFSKPKKTKFTIEEKNSKQDDPIRRAFSKMISQLKGRSKSEKTPAEPNIRAHVEEKSQDSHPTSRTTLASRIISSLSSSPSRLSVIKKSTPLTHDSTSSTSGIP